MDNQNLQKKLLDTAISGELSSLQQALKDGASPNIRYNGGIPLIWAINKNNELCARTLLKNRADCHLSTDTGHSPLSEAIYQVINNNNYHYIELLAPHIDENKYKSDKKIEEIFNSLNPEAHNAIKEIINQYISKAKEADAKTVGSQPSSEVEVSTAQGIDSSDKRRAV